MYKVVTDAQSSKVVAHCSECGWTRVAENPTGNERAKVRMAVFRHVREKGHSVDVRREEHVVTMPRSAIA